MRQIKLVRKFITPMIKHGIFMIRPIKTTKNVPKKPLKKEVKLEKQKKAFIELM